MSKGEAERVTGAETNLMTLEGRIAMYASWEERFETVAEHIERKAAKEKRAQQNEKAQR